MRTSRDPEGRGAGAGDASSLLCAAGPASLAGGSLAGGSVAAFAGPALSGARLEERDLVRRTLAGEREAFRMIVLAQQAFLANLVFRQTGDRSATEDLVQETFLRAYRALGRYDERYRLSTWLARIALNVSRDHGRRERVRDVAAARIAVEAHHDRAPSDDASRRETNAALQDALARLPEPQREVVVLAVWGGYTQREIAALLELPLGTVKTRQRSALTKLRTLVASLEPGGAS